jgi:hypothetical protein
VANQRFIIVASRIFTASPVTHRLTGYSKSRRAVGDRDVKPAPTVVITP